MTILTITESDNDCVQIPKALLEQLGWQAGSTIEADIEAKSVQSQLILHPTNTLGLSAQDRALLEQGFGMIKINPANAPKGSLFDFDASEHVTLFDED